MKETFEDLQLWRYGSKVKIDKAAGDILKFYIDPGIGNRIFLAHGLLQSNTMAVPRTFYATVNDGETASQILFWFVYGTITLNDRRSLTPIASATSNINIPQLNNIQDRIISGSERLLVLVVDMAQNDEVTLFLRCYCRFKPTVTVTPDPAGVDATEINYYDEVYA